MLTQVSIFLENRPGSLEELTQTLSKNNINMRAFSLADTYDFGIARTIVDNAEYAAAILRKNNYVVNLTEVIGVEVQDKAGALNKILQTLKENNQNLEYMYAFIGRKSNSAYMIMRTTDIASSVKVLENKKFHLVSSEDLANI
ncbi:MAG: ACT domain-containing protein [Treponemataceae bacterium]